MKNFTAVLVLVLVAGFASACGSSGNGAAGGSAPGGAAGPQQASACATAWSNYVAASPAGRTLVYTLSTHMNTGGHDTVISTDTETDSITESSDDHVTTSITTHHSTHSFTIAKSDFTGVCGNGGTAHPPTSGSITEQDQQAMDVAAGHFECNHVKFQSGGSTNSTLETWTDTQGQFLVKSVSVTNTGGSVVTSIKELTSKS